jgi:hypothetical protein
LPALLIVNDRGGIKNAASSKKDAAGRWFLCFCAQVISAGKEGKFLESSNKKFGTYSYYCCGKEQLQPQGSPAGLPYPLHPEHE